VLVLKPIVLRLSLGLAALMVLASATLATPAFATSVNIGTLGVGKSFSDTIQSPGPTIGRDYDFHLDQTVSGVTVLATGLGQSGGGFGLDSVTISLFDAAHDLIATATGATLASFDSFLNSGIALKAGDYLFTVLGDVTPGKQGFISVSLAANNVATTPIPAGGLMLVTGLGALGGLALRRRRASGGGKAPGGNAPGLAA
jgi:hypothetical protein